MTCCSPCPSREEAFYRQLKYPSAFSCLNFLISKCPRITLMMSQMNCTFSWSFVVYRILLVTYLVDLRLDVLGLLFLRRLRENAPQTLLPGQDPGQF